MLYYDMEVQEKGNNMLKIMALTGWTKEEWIEVGKKIFGLVGFVGLVMSVPYLMYGYVTIFG